MSTALGVRRLDIRLGSKGVEVKVGRVSLTKSIRAQIAKDKWILDNSSISGVDEITWAFYQSDATGAIGPTASVESALEKAGIKYVSSPTYVYQ